MVVPNKGLLTVPMAAAGGGAGGGAPRERWGDATLGNVVVFVDPLDGTKEFTEGITSAVTVLIGVALEGRSVHPPAPAPAPARPPAHRMPFRQGGSLLAREVNETRV